MYVAKINRQNMLWRVSLFEKRWSESMSSNEILADVTALVEKAKYNLFVPLSKKITGFEV